MFTVRRLCLAGLGALLFSASLGCGFSASPRTVKGKLVLLPNMKLQETDTINLTFVPEGEGSSAVADVSAKDATFTAQVPPGKYKIALSVTPYAGTKDAEKREQAFVQKYAPFAPGTTPLRYEVSSEPVQTVTIDLAQGSVSPN